MITLPQPIQKVCPICDRIFAAHPNAIYCTTTCATRAGRRRRSSREKQALPTETPTLAADSPYQLIVTNITAEVLSTLYNNVSLHIYPKDIRIDGPIPSGVPHPPDVILEDLGDHHVIYHKSRQLVFP